MEGTGANWRKSSYSGSNGGQCVEVASTSDGIAVRDTTDRSGLMLRVSPGAWQALTATVREGCAARLPLTARARYQPGCDTASDWHRPIFGLHRPKIGRSWEGA